MYWYNSALPILRSLINDFDESEYTDSRLLTILVHASYLIQQETDLLNTYTINIENESISPDPYSDKDFINLMIFKANLIIATGEYKKSANQSLKITDAGCTIDVSGKADNKRAILKNAQDMWDRAILQYQTGVNNVGGAVLSPYTQVNQWTQ
jgi:hypothetical protein